MNDSGMSNLLKWSIQNSAAEQGQANGSEQAAEKPKMTLNQEALKRLMGGPSDADRMLEAMVAIKSPEVDLENKLVAFDNFEQLIENLDNANNMANLKLWMPLVEELDNREPELQRMAAWCMGTAVQNNIKSQESCLVVEAVPKLVNLFVTGATAAVKKKAVFALSSEVRNYQPALNEMLKYLPTEFHPNGDKIDAEDMAAVSELIDRLRESVR